MIDLFLEIYFWKVTQSGPKVALTFDVLKVKSYFWARLCNFFRKTLPVQRTPIYFDLKGLENNAANDKVINK